MAVATRRRTLQIGSGLELPIDWMTMSSVVYGARGAGKSTLGRKLAEEVATHGQRFCAVDPTGAWWGLKSSESGTEEGLSVIIFGGDHADVPLEPGAGAMIADVVAEISQSTILDLEGFSKGKQIAFLGTFFERLYDRNRDPLLLLMDEAQRYAPQKPMSPEASKTLGAVEDIVKLGRKHGVGPVVFTQRGSGLNKEVSELADILIAFRTPGVLDQGRIKDWLEANVTEDQKKAVMATISGLPTGTAIFASGHPDLRIFGTYQIDRPTSFDSSATPKVGERRREPKVLAKPDLDALKDRMAETIERAKADDPKELKRQVADLRQQLSRASWDDPKLDGTDGAHPAWWRGSDYGYQKGKADAKPERVEVPIDEQLGQLKDVAQRIEFALDDLTKVKDEIRGEWVRVSSLVVAEPKLERISPLRPEARRPPPPPVQRPAALPRPPVDREVSAPVIEGVGRAERNFLTVLAQYPDGVDRARLAILAGYKVRSGHIGNTLSKLRTNGLIEKSSDPLRITDFGLQVLGPYEPLPQPGPQLIAHWMDRLGPAEKAFLEPIIRVYPNSISGPEVAELAGYKPASGHVGNTLSKLRTMGLIEGPSSAVRASEALVGG